MTLAWWFCSEARILPNNDGRKVRKGQLHVHAGPLEICRSGLHASRVALDALQFAPGPILCRVECSGEMQERRDKLVCRRRRYLAVVDASRVLREFACDCADRALSLAKDRDPRSVAAVTVSRRFARGEATDEELAAAKDAARDAAKDAARDAAWGAASVAAWGAARDAAWGAASAAAKDAAKDAAWNAEVKWQADEFERRCLELVSATIRGSESK